jgi:hypothetical protein
VHDPSGLAVTWILGDGSKLSIVANLGDATVSSFERPPGNLLFATREELPEVLENGDVPPWSAGWFLAISSGEPE